MSVDHFQTVDVPRFRQALADLHAVVGRGKGRVEVTHPDCDDICVLISKAELDSLERALQIFSETLEFKQMSEQIAEIAAAVGTPSVQTSAPAVDN